MSDKTNDADTAESKPARRKRPTLVVLVSRQLVMIEVTHERFCEPLGECHCTKGVVGRARRSSIGVRGLARVERTFGPTVSFPAGVMMALPEEVLEEPGIQAALKAKRLRRVAR